MRGKIIILVAMLALLIYNSLIYNGGIVYAQSKAYPGYDERYDPLIGGIQIEVQPVQYGRRPPWKPYNFPDTATPDSTLMSYYSPSICSLAFPVKFQGDGGRIANGIITAGHCETKGPGIINDVYQPYKVYTPHVTYNYIGQIIRSIFHNDADLDAALIGIEGRGGYPPRKVAAFIFENAKPHLYYIGDKPDINKQVGIIAYIKPTKDMEGKTVVYKSGRTTGLTYGLIKRINARYGAGDFYLNNLIEIHKCAPGKCYDDPFLDKGDSGGPVYIRIPIYFTWEGHIQYGAQVLGIVSMGNPENTVLYAAWAVKVKEYWPDIEFLTCGPSDSYACW